MESRFPHAPPLWNLLAFLSSVMPTCFCLVVAFEISIGSHLRPQRFLILFFCCSVCRPKQWYGIHPTCSAQIVRPPQYPSYHKCQLLVGCCFVQPIDGHLRLRSHPSLKSLMCCILVPQMKEQTATRAHPTLRALYGPIGISGAKIWVHGGCGLGERWQSC